MGDVHGRAASLTESEAQALTGQIRSLGEGIADRVDLLVGKVRQAREGEAHAALGYQSWSDYVQTEFAGVLPRLERQSRRELVNTLTETGMSSRAIAPVVGVSKSQVAEDVSSSGHLLVEATDNQLEQAIAAIPTTNVVGIDGKAYPRPESRKGQRSPLADSYVRAAHDLQKIVERLARLHADDRFLRNRAEVKQRNGRVISNADALLQSIETDLNGPKLCNCGERIPVKRRLRRAHDRAGTACADCGNPLNAVLAAAGETTHPTCGGADR